MTLFTLFARALLAYSVNEHQEGFATRIDAEVQPGLFTLQDDGRGMGLHREGYVESLVGLVVARSGEVQLHGIGLSLIAASTPRLAIESRRGGSIWRQSFSWGAADGPPRSEPGGPETGTRVMLATAPGALDVDPAALRVQIERWRASHPGLTITLR